MRMDATLVVRAMFACFPLGLIALPGAATASTVEDPNACFTPPGGQYTCFATRAEAEQALRALSPVGRYLYPYETYPSSNPEWVWVAFRADMQEPESHGQPGYRVGGWTPANLGCVPSSPPGPGPDYCESESEMHALWVAHRAAALGSQCEYRRHDLIGGASAPDGLMGLWTFPRPRSGAQVYSRLPHQGGRFIDEEWWCPGWGSPNPVVNPTQVVKVIPFTCPEGFAVGGSAEDWPRVCQPQHQAPHLLVRVRRQESCAANANPCHPATGEKQRHEVDFEFAGRPFTRHYRSQDTLVAGMAGVGWTHTFASRLDSPLSPAYMRYVDPSGSYMPAEYASQVDGVLHYRFRGMSDRSARQTATTYEITDIDGVVRIFDRTSGRMLRLVDKADARRNVSFEYDADGLLTAAVDGQGRSLGFRYTTATVDLPLGGLRYQKLLRGVDLPDGSSVAYRYDAMARLIEVHYPDGRVRRYHYDEQGQNDATNPYLLTGITDESGSRYATFTYDATGRVTSSTLAGGVDRTELDYVAANVVDVRTPLGEVKRHTYAPGALRRLLSVSGSDGLSSTSYDSRGFPHLRTDANGLRVRYTFDASGLLERIEHGVPTSNPGQPTCPAGSSYFGSDYGAGCGIGTCWSTSPFDGGQSAVPLGYPGWYYSCPLPPEAPQDWRRTTRLEWSQSQRLPIGRRVEAADGSLQEHRRWTYNARGQRLTESLLGSDGTPARTRSWAYCEEDDINDPVLACPAVGLLRGIFGPGAQAVEEARFEYFLDSDESGCAAGGPCHRRGDLRKVTSALGHQTEYLRYDEAGRVRAVRDPNGVVTEFAYHPRGWLLSRTVKGVDGAPDATTTFGYTATGLVDRVTQADGSWLGFTYDSAHRLVAVFDSLGNAIHYTLDPAGNRIAEEVHDPDGAVTRSLSRVFDQLGRLETIADAAANPTDFEYDPNGNPTAQVAPDGVRTGNDYDPLNRLRRSLADVGGIEAETRFAYDALDRLIKVTDPKGLDTEYVYDGLGNLVELRSPDTGVTSYTHDAAGNRLSQTDARGITTLYSYDALNRLTDIAYPTPGLGVGLDHDAVPADCPVGERHGIGRLGRMDDASGDTRYCYDHRGNPVRKVQRVDMGPELTVRYGYSAADRLVRLVYPSGAEVSYQRDAAGRISAVRARPTAGAAEISLVAEADYLPFGPLTRLAFGNGRVMEKAYDQDYRPLAITDDAAAGFSLAFDVDAVGNITGLTEATGVLSASTRTVAYDALGRLTEFGGQGLPLERFEYDATGNRTRKVAGSSTPYTYDPDSHRLMQVGSSPRDYDAAGNMLQRGTNRHFEYDDSGRMVRYYSNGALSREYRHNGHGQRVYVGVVNNRANDKYFVYDESGRLLGEYASSGARLKEYVWLDDTLIAVLANHDGSTHQYVLTDHLGTPRAIVHPSRNVIIWRWDLLPTAFGEHPAIEDPDGDGRTYTFHLRYPGQYRDNNGLHYNYFRDYDPGVGRYVQSDPIGLAGGVATYGYVRSSPVRFIDPFGLTEEDVARTWRQVTRSFDDLNPRGTVVCGPLPGDTYGRTRFLTGNITVNERYCKSPCLSREDWEDLFFTLFHEGMHSTDPWYQGFFRRSHHDGIFAREIYERDRGHGLRTPSPRQPLWGTPRSSPVDLEALYREFSRGADSCCKGQ